MESGTEVKDPMTGLMPSELESALNVWKIIRQNQKFHGMHFYQRLMTKHPEYQSSFSFFKDKQMDHLIRDRDPRLVRQSLRIMLALDSIFMNLHRADRVIDLCYQLGYRHHGYGLDAEMFVTSRSVLISSVQMDLGTSVVDDRAVRSINAVFDFFVPHSLQGMKDAAAGKPLQNKTEKAELVHTSHAPHTEDAEPAPHDK